MGILEGRVAIIGAAGEIGARITQNLKDEFPVRAVSRKKSPRLARWKDLDFAAAELPLDKGKLKSILQGCQAVVNCVVDKKSFESEEVSIKSNEQGVRDLIEASIDLGVKKFIHLSTIAVLPPRLTDLTDPYKYSEEKDWYTRVKIATEKVALEYKDKIDLCIIRPGIVYGPHLHWSKMGFYKTQNFKVIVPQVSNTMCHAIHIDDLVGLIRQLLRLERRLPELLHGINPEPVTWKNYYEMHANALGWYDDVVAEIPATNIKAYHASQKRLVEGPGFKERTLQSLRNLYRDLPRPLVENGLSKKVIEILKVINRGLPFYAQLYLPPPKESSFPNEFELELYSSTAHFTPSMVGGDQGYTYKIPFAEGVRNAAAWWNFQV